MDLLSDSLKWCFEPRCFGFFTLIHLKRTLKGKWTILVVRTWSGFSSGPGGVNSGLPRQRQLVSNRSTPSLLYISGLLRWAEPLKEVVLLLILNFDLLGIDSNHQETFTTCNHVTQHNPRVQTTSSGDFRSF